MVKLVQFIFGFFFCLFFMAFNPVFSAFMFFMLLISFLGGAMAGEQED